MLRLLRNKLFSFNKTEYSNIDNQFDDEYVAVVRKCMNISQFCKYDIYDKYSREFNKYIDIMLKTYLQFNDLRNNFLIKLIVFNYKKPLKCIIIVVEDGLLYKFPRDTNTNVIIYRHNKVIFYKLNEIPII